MSNMPILITGCQRSGTTLVGLILDSHPQITTIDELEFQNDKLDTYLNDPQFHPYVALKLPVSAHETRNINMLPGIRVYWCIRDPRDVVLSMLRLNLPLDDGAAIPWISHPLGGIREINRCLDALASRIQQDCSRHVQQQYRSLIDKSPMKRTTLDNTFLGALCWRLKQELLAIYDTESITYHVIQYENLISQPKEVIYKLLAFIGVPWHANVLCHHQLHHGTSVGLTDNTRAIDCSNTGKWKNALSDEQLAIIKSLCGVTARRYAYTL